VLCKRHTGPIARRLLREHSLHDVACQLSQEEIVMLRTVIAMFVLAGFLAGCNTMEGAGKDIQRGGEKLQGSAERNK
jgi:entericidin B